MNLFNTSWTSALSMTLLHSLWQGLAITLFTAIILKLFSSRNASLKYLIKTGAFFLLFASSFCTFFFLLPSPSSGADENYQVINFGTFTARDSAIEINSALTYLKAFLNFLQIHQTWIVMGWVAGVFLSSLRFAAGITYLRYLRNQAVRVSDEWMKTMERLSKKLGVKNIVQLSESISVQTPIVVGYLKPIVLMPVGLLSGLSTKQVEVILIHELAHIKRHDYLINFIQSLGETLFFFNPFVWILSAWIRNERENCCDDIVLSEGYDPQLYVKTLFEVETSRFENGKLALALTGNKNQLLNRIKRIMEHSAKNQNGKEKLIPVVLLVLGLVFASWLSINPKEEQAKLNTPLVMKKINVADTAKKPVVSSYSRKSVITYDEKGVPHEEVIENYEGDDIPEIVEMPATLDLDFDIPEIAELPEFAVMLAPGFSPNMMNFTLDTIPGWKGYDEERMKEFQDKFQAEFKEKFGDFYAKNQKEMEKMMKDVQEKMSGFDQGWQKEAQAEMDRAEREMARIAPIQEEHLKQEMARLGSLTELQKLARINDDQMQIAEKRRWESLQSMKAMESNIVAFDKEVKDELVKDGYLGKNEKVETLNFGGDGKIEVNGKPIKVKDKKKYNEIHQKYFQKRERRYNPE